MTGIQRLLLLVLLCSLAGCGFQLRGQAHLPEILQPSQIETDASIERNSALIRRLRELLNLNGIELNDTANTRIILRDASLLRRTLATGSRGDLQEYTLTYRLTVQVLHDETVLLPTTVLSASRNLLYRETEVLGQLEGERLAREELVREIASAILRRLQHLTPE